MTLTRLKHLYKHYPRRPRRTGLLMHLYHFWEEKMSKGGQTLVLVLLLSIFVEFLPGMTWLVGFILLTLLALIFSLIYSLFPIKDVKVFVHPILSAEENQEFLIRMHIVNKSKKPLLGIGVNWMRLADGLIPKEEIPYLDRIEAGEQRNIDLPLKADRRGHFFIHKIMILQIDPLGLINRRKHQEIHWNLNVLPSPFQHSKPIWTDRSFLSEVRKNHNIGIESEEEFKGLRHFQNGDPLKMIHHKSWARIGRPVVREYHLEAPLPEIKFVIDTSLESQWHKFSFELLLRYFVKIHKDLRTQGFSLQYLFLSDENTLIEDETQLTTLLSKVKAQKKARIQTELSKNETNIYLSTRPLDFQLENNFYYFQISDRLPSQSISSQHFILGAK